jgi:hypothetical protein
VPQEGRPGIFRTGSLPLIPGLVIKILWSFITLVCSHIAHTVELPTSLVDKDCGATHLDDGKVRAELKKRAPAHADEVDTMWLPMFKE